jgi:3-oxoacyl-[acyl-carrier-protein] synthase-3
LNAKKHVAIERVEYQLPERIVTNAQLDQEHPDWKMDAFQERSGVRARHIAAPDETSLDLAIGAARKLLNNLPVDPRTINGVIFCTQTPEHPLPSNAFLLQAELGIPQTAMAFDYNLACSGFVYGLAMIQGLIEIGLGTKILLINADTYSKIINPGDRATRGLFGDGAAATLIGAVSEGDSSRIIDVDLASSGGDFRSFYVPAGGVRMPASDETRKETADLSGNTRTQHDIHMDGFGVWKFIAREVPRQIAALLLRNGLSVEDIDLFFFHQASKMTLDSLVARLKIPLERVVINMELIGNTVSASIPIAMADAERSGRLVRGQRIILSGFGAGLSWGTVLMVY